MSVSGMAVLRRILHAQMNGRRRKGLRQSQDIGIRAHILLHRVRQRLRWDSLGEFMALAVSLEEMGIKEGNDNIKLLAKTLDRATGKLLDNDKSPSRRTGELDNRGSHFYLAKFWAEELAAQDENAELKAKFAPLAKTLAENEEKIVTELAEVQGKSVDIGGYYAVDQEKVNAVMRPSATLNAALATI